MKTKSWSCCAAVAVVALALSLLPARAVASGEFKSHGFMLPGGSVKIDEDRFRLPQSWEESLKFYKTAYPPQKFPRHALHSQSGVRALHIDNPHPAEDEWQGVNLYENKGEVRVFVLNSLPTQQPQQPAGGARPGPEAQPAGAAKKPGPRG
ncbi:MAG TPA: hypothetical protein VN874_10315 [Myxococcales bacterium]|nr:hypothetical protein [Myxococcales bacterium]